LIPQLRSADEQLVVLLLLSQYTVPDAQAAVAVQRAFGLILGRLAAKTTSLGCVVQGPVTAGCPRIAARASGVRGAWLGVWAKAATETKRTAQATIHAFFINLSSYRDRYSIAWRICAQVGRLPNIERSLYFLPVCSPDQPDSEEPAMPSAQAAIDEGVSPSPNSA
jgi:hypothetical protein